jgi:hypothetical protein
MGRARLPRNGRRPRFGVRTPFTPFYVAFWRGGPHFAPSPALGLAAGAQTGRGIALQRDGRFPSMWIPSGCAVIQELAPFSDPPR